MKSSHLRVGLVGAGQISEFHVRALRRVPGIDLVGVADMDARRRSELAERHGIPHTAPSLDGLAALGLDVVHVLTPPVTHADIALKALEHGCHVYVEKPLATTVEECDTLAARAAALGRFVGVGHSLLEDPFVRRGAELVEAGAVGELISIDHYRCQAAPPYAGGPLPDYYRDGGFPFRDLGVHALYVIERFLGSVVDAVPQIDSSETDPNFICDEWRVLLRTERGNASIHLSWRARPQQNVYVLHGTAGTLRIDLVAMTVTVRRARPVPEHVNRILNTLAESAQAARQSVANAVRVVSGRVRQYHGLQQAIIAFYERVQSGRPPAVGPASARSTVYWTEEIARAGDEYKRKTLAFRKPNAAGATTLVTGASGFVGRHLVTALRDSGRPVRVFVRSAVPQQWKDDPGIEVVTGDLGDPSAVDEAVRGMTRVIHLGAAMRGAAHDFERATVAGTQNVVDSALRHDVRMLIHMSSLAVLHNAAADGNSVITETWPLEPRATERGHYTRTKLQAENCVREAIAARGLTGVILRPAEIVDARRPLLTASIAQRLGRLLLVFGDGSVPIPTVEVGDVVAAVLIILERTDLRGRVIHLVAEHAPTQNELLERYGQVTGERLRIVRLPKLALYGAAFASEKLFGVLGRRAPLSVYRLRSALARRRFDCSAAERDLGWKAGAVPLDATGQARALVMRSASAAQKV